MFIEIVRNGSWCRLWQIVKYLMMINVFYLAIAHLELFFCTKLILDEVQVDLMCQSWNSYHIVVPSTSPSITYDKQQIVFPLIAFLYLYNVLSKWTHNKNKILLLWHLFFSTTLLLQQSHRHPFKEIFRDPLSQSTLFSTHIDFFFFSHSERTLLY